jgi:hypothetical protein
VWDYASSVFQVSPFSPYLSQDGQTPIWVRRGQRTSRWFNPDRNISSNVNYGWIPHNAGFGFLDMTRPALGVFASLDRFWAPQLMDRQRCRPPWLWTKTESKWFRFYEVASHWPRVTGSQRFQRHSTAKIISTK